MKKIITIFVFFLIGLSAKAQWVEVASATDTLNANANINAMCKDAAGNIYVAGEFTDSIFPTGNRYVAKWNGNTWSKLGGLNVAGERYDATLGYYVWNQSNSINALCADSSGNIYAAGGFTNSSGNIYVAKWNGASWSELGGNNSFSSIWSGGINYLYFDKKTGYIYAGTALTDTSSTYEIAKWDGVSWSRLGGTNAAFANGVIGSICTDKFGNVYVGGNTRNLLSVAKFNGTSWSNLGGNNSFAGSNICSDTLGNIYAVNSRYVSRFNGISWSVIGNFTGWMYSGIISMSIDKQNHLFLMVTTIGNVAYNFDVQVQKYTGANWQLVGGWFAFAASFPQIYPNPMLIDNSGNVVAVQGLGFGIPSYVRTYLCSATTANLNQPICFSQLPYTWHGKTFTSTHLTDTFLLTNYHGCDSLLTLNLTIGSNSSTSNSTLTACGNYFFHHQTLTQSGIYHDTLVNYTGCDSFITLHLTVKPISTSSFSQTICGNQTYLFNGHYLNVAGNYFDTLQNYVGCDSIITLNLTVKPISTDSFSQSICGSQTYLFNGHYLNVAGHYFDTLQNYVGCDSIITLNLTVKLISTDSFSQSICGNQTYFFNGHNLNVAGNYFDTLQNYVGCDSFVILHLIVISTSASTLNQSICAGSSYTFHNQSLTQYGTYYDTLVNYTGCDSIITLNLTVKSPITDSFAVAICSNRSYAFGGHSLTSAGYYSDTLSSYQSCDSIVTLHLTINPTQASAFTYTTCSNQPYVFNGHTLIAAGTYVDTMQTYLGCDSIVTLNLVVNPAPTALFTLYPNTAAPHYWLALNQCIGTATPLTYSWSWGDASANDTGATPSHIYAAAGGYNVCVSVTDANNCTATYCDSSYLSRMSSANSMVTINVVASLPNGINDVQNENESLQVYPNPTSSELRIRNEELRIEKVEVENVLGQSLMMFNSSFITPHSSFDIANLPSGIYFLKATDEKGLQHVAKFVKQ